MFKGSLDKLKSMFVKKEGEEEQNPKKKIENLVVFLVILIITIVAINLIWSDDNENAAEDNNILGYKQLASNNNIIETSNIEISDNNLEKRLEDILSKIEGVGDVNVLLTYSESSQIVAMYNENTKQSLTEETDDTGGNRKIEQTDVTKDIIYEEADGKKVPITQKVINPKIEGAVIIAEGANNVNIKANIIQAVEAATGLATHKVQVFEMQK